MAINTGPAGANPSDPREILRVAALRDEQEFHEAVQDLKQAVSRPFRMVHRFTSNPLPWMISAVLVGFYLGHSDGNGNNDSGDEEMR
jgi:hypothetical protein